MRRYKPQVPTLLAAVFAVSVAAAQPLPTANRPEDVGFSAERLERARKVLKADVEKHRLPGAVLLFSVSVNAGAAYSQEVRLSLK